LGHKVHPTGFRLGVIRGWQSKWYNDTHYAEFVLEDAKLREAIKARYREAAISLIEIDRQAKDVTLTLHTARPGIVIGRGGQRVDEMRLYLERLIGKRVRLNIQEVRQPELDAYLVARSIAEQIERRVAYRRAMKQSIFRTIQSGAKGIRVSCAGRLGNAEIARRQTSHQGQVPLHTLRADIDYGFTEAHTTLGRIGVKVWIYKGQVLPETKTTETEAKSAEAAKPIEAVAESAAPAPEAVAEKPAEAAAAPVAATAEKPAEAAAEAKPARPRARRAAKAAATTETEEKTPKTAAVATEEAPAKAAAKKSKEKPAGAVKKPNKAATSTAKKEKTAKAETPDIGKEEAKDAAA
jgi:small subunit ribosomal protein S3